MFKSFYSFKLILKGFIDIAVIVTFISQIAWASNCSLCRFTTFYTVRVAEFIYSIISLILNSVLTFSLVIGFKLAQQKTGSTY